MAVNLASLIGRALLRKRTGSFMRDERGVTAIEFSLLALPFFSIICAILETSIVFLSGQVLDSAVQDTGRFIRTGQAFNANFDLAKYRTALCDRLYGLFSCNDLHIEVQVAGNFNAVNITAPIDMTCKTKATCVWKSDRPETYMQSQPSNIVVVQVYYKWPTLLNIGGFNLASLATNERVMGAAAVFRNEPFS